MTIIIKGGNDYDYDSIPHCNLLATLLLARKAVELGEC